MVHWYASMMHQKLFPPENQAYIVCENFFKKG